MHTTYVHTSFQRGDSYAGREGKGQLVFFYLIFLFTLVERAKGNLLFFLFNFFIYAGREGKGQLVTHTQRIRIHASVHMHTHKQQ